MKTRLLVSSLLMFFLVCVAMGFAAICCCFFFFQAEDGIRDLVRSRGLGDVYKRQAHHRARKFRYASRSARTFTQTDAEAMEAAAHGVGPLELSLIHI